MVPRGTAREGYARRILRLGILLNLRYVVQVDILGDFVRDEVVHHMPLDRAQSVSWLTTHPALELPVPVSPEYRESEYRQWVTQDSRFEAFDRAQRFQNMVSDFDGNCHTIRFRACCPGRCCERFRERRSGLEGVAGPASTFAWLPHTPGTGISRYRLG